jgi:Gpi18-like mannosyltransferase
MLYASFLLLCLYFLLTDRPVAAMAAFAISFSFKGQAIFFLPFLAVLTLKKRIPVWTFVLIPLIYTALALPTVIAGRDFYEVLTLYFGRVELFSALSMHAANLYSVVPGRFANPALIGGLIFAALFIAAWTLYYGLCRFPLTPRNLLLTALLSTVIVPFLLPKMHDRFFFPADLTSFVLAFFWPPFWYVAAGYQVISSLVYFIFLHSVTTAQNTAILRVAVVLNTVMVAHLVVRQFLIIRNHGTSGVESKTRAAG